MNQAVYETVHKGRIRTLAEIASSHINRQIAAYFGDKIPMYLVAEFPRSGGTWLSSMMSDYLRCAKPGLSVLPSACRAVMHNHWNYHKKFKRTIYLVRDGRDVFISLYFYSIRRFKLRDINQKSNKSQARLDEIFQKYPNSEDTLSGMKEFLKVEMEEPRFLSVNWAQHIQMWHGQNGRPGIMYLKYEDLLTDPVNSLRKAVEFVSPIVADDRLLKRSVDHFSMESTTGRKPGTAVNNDFIRKGIAGDWRNYFDKEIAREFDKYAGNELIVLGYEKDRSWVDECPNKI